MHGYFVVSDGVNVHEAFSVAEAESETCSVPKVPPWLNSRVG